MKKIILLGLIGVVFMLSSESPKDSHARSSHFLEASIGQVYNLDLLDKDVLHYTVRKMAHFTIYFLIGLATVVCVSEKKRVNKPQLILSLTLLLLFAFFDEVHQIYVGRSFSYKDILIDFSGGLLAIVIYYQYKKKNQKDSIFCLR